MNSSGLNVSDNASNKSIPRQSEEMNEIKFGKGSRLNTQQSRDIKRIDSANSPEIPVNKSININDKSISIKASKDSNQDKTIKNKSLKESESSHKVPQSRKTNLQVSQFTANGRNEGIIEQASREDSINPILKESDKFNRSLVEGESPSETSISKSVVKSIKSKTKIAKAQYDALNASIMEALTKINENKARIDNLEIVITTNVPKEMHDFKVGMAEDMIALESKINRNYEFYK